MWVSPEGAKRNHETERKSKLCSSPMPITPPKSAPP